MSMTGATSCSIKTGAVTEHYGALIRRLYKKYAHVAKAKIAEFEKTFSPGNPFFTYGNAENYFLFDYARVVGHIAAIADARSGKAGYIGFFECENRQQYADMLFEHAARFLERAGKHTCRGPINVSVWHNFRVSYPEDNPPFFLEPFTRGYYRDLFLRNKFSISHRNITTAESIDKTRIKNYRDFYVRSVKNGYSYERVNRKNAHESIAHIYFLTNEIFKGSYSFYTISKEEFLFSIHAIQRHVEAQKPHFISVAKNSKQEPVGFFFAVPDVFNPRLKRLVIKTIGIIPAYRGLGLAEAMLYVAYANAASDGFQALIFSTMSVDNERIRLLTGQNLMPYRKYEVYEKNIVC